MIDAAFVQSLWAAAEEPGIRAADDTAHAAELLRLVAQVRRMTAEPDATSSYSDAMLATAIFADRVTDTVTHFAGTEAVTARYTPTPITYDLNATAARIWEEKINALVGAGTYDYSADGQSYSLSQVVAQYQQRQAYYTARRRVRCPRVAVARRPITTEGRL